MCVIVYPWRFPFTFILLFLLLTTRAEIASGTLSCSNERLVLSAPGGKWKARATLSEPPQDHAIRKVQKIV
jgi:hypothetical protein